MLHGDGSAKCIYEWKSKRYQMENILSANKPVSTASKKNVCITTSGIVYLDCHLPNIVYVGSFSRYSAQYTVEID